MFDYNYYPLINKATRTTKGKCSSIDHIRTNVIGAQINRAILAHKIADHLPIFQVSSIGTPLLKTENKKCCFSEPNLKRFYEMLQTKDFEEVYDMLSPDDSFKEFFREINPPLVSCFKRKKRQRKNLQRCVWYNRELLLFSRKKNRLNGIYLKKKTSIFKNKYHKLKNYYFHMIKQKKKKHKQNQYQKHQKNIRKSWQMVKNLLGKVCEEFSSTSISYNNTIINKPVEIANCFNDHFSTIAEKLNDELPPSPTNLRIICHLQIPPQRFSPLQI